MFLEGTLFGVAYFEGTQKQANFSWVTACQSGKPRDARSVIAAMVASLGSGPLAERDMVLHDGHVFRPEGAI